MTRLPKMLPSLALMAVFGLMEVSQATAQTTLSSETLAAIAAGTPAAPTTTGIEVKEGSGAGIRYISGGAGFSERAEMEAKRKQFPLKLVLSAGRNGEYIVADKLVLKSSHGEVLSTSEVGPLVMIAAPRGRYTLEVSYMGQTRRQTVTLGNQPRQVNLGFSG